MSYTHIGKIRGVTNVAEKYYELAVSDEETGDYLEQGQKYRQAIYFYVQAMEKYIKSKVFSKVNPRLEYFSQKNRHHSINESVDFLVEISSTDGITKEQIKQQIETNALHGIRFNQLHNQLRYPSLTRRNEYICFEYSENDCNEIKKSLNSLKNYLDNLYKVD